MSIEDIKRTWEVEAYVQDATRSDVVHWIVTLQDKITQLERVNKEWETLWEPIDELVRPLTPLGESVRDKAVELIKMSVWRVKANEL